MERKTVTDTRRLLRVSVINLHVFSIRVSELGHRVVAVTYTRSWARTIYQLGLCREVVVVHL